jgi:hypothetical protein
VKSWRAITAANPPGSFTPSSQLRETPSGEMLFAHSGINKYSGSRFNGSRLMLSAAYCDQISSDPLAPIGSTLQHLTI